MVTPVRLAAISELKRTGPLDEAMAKAPAARAKPASATRVKMPPQVR